MRISRVSFSALLLAFSACTQPPAMVELKGQNSYGQSTNVASSHIGSSAPSSYVTSNAAPAPADYHTATNSNASVAPIGVSDVAAPAKVEKKDTKVAAVTPLVAPVASVKPQPKIAQAVVATPAPQPQVVAQAKEQRINPWTKKPHASDAAVQQQVSLESAKPSPAAVSRFMWPVASKKVISGFGPKGGGKVNDGIDIASANGEPVWAAADGEVVYVGNELAGYGNMVLIKHPGNKTTAYAHMSRATVDKYDRIKQGDIIGYVGSSGNVKAPQLHFAIRDGKEPVDPAKYVSRNVASN